MIHTNIIQADESHAAAIASIGKKSFRDAFEHLFQHRVELFDYLTYTYNPLKLVRSLKKENNIYLLAYRDGKPAGFVKIKKHSLNDQIESGAQMELQKIYVLTEHQGSGVGTALMKEAKLITRQFGPDYLWLDTHVSNDRARRFYERHGFETMGTYYFTIGSQSFENFFMALPIAVKVPHAQ